jgi:hypothetical protein
MPFALLGAVIVAVAGFGVMRFFRYRRLLDEDDARAERRQAEKRRNHFRGSLDMELEQEPPPGPGA